ncbi:uncharacterized protein LOC141639777 [Silene latifolia]|uniref:uncharacterized protein LOC141639777 n=1 Tax=Silene latifolia TaxID=37657 RepID=UPI003D77DFCA
MEHLFRECEIARHVWAFSDLGIRDCQSLRMSIGKWIINWINYLGKLENAEFALVRFLATLWCLWTMENRIIFQGAVFHLRMFLNEWFRVVGLVDQVVNRVREEKESMAVGSYTLADNQILEIRESKPICVVGSPGSCTNVRIMVDAGWKSNTFAGIGWVAFGDTWDCIF